MKRNAGSRISIVPIALTMLSAAAMANVVVFFPGQPGDWVGVPAYARIERAPDGAPLVHHDQDWAAIVFYRDPTCVPADFNLLEFFDAPRAFGCTMTVEGFEIWKNGPTAGDQGPIHTVSHGSGAVPVWFVRWDALKAALSDGLLTMSELRALNPRKGTASFFKETLQPYGVAQQTNLQMVARGVLEDGQTFDLISEENLQSEKNNIESKTRTKISFK